MNDAGMNYEQLGRALTASALPRIVMDDIRSERTIREAIIQNERCPILFSDAAHYCKIPESSVERWCSEGCSPECGRLIWEKYGCRCENPDDPIWTDLPEFVKLAQRAATENGITHND